MLILASYLANRRTTRCGVIPYTVIDDTVHLCLARDKQTKELGDFGGGVRKNEAALEAGLREFSEESRNIFSQVCKSANDISTSLALVDGARMAIVFIPVESRWLHEAQPLFESKGNIRKKSDEVSELVWVDEKKFEKLIYEDHQGNPPLVMWSKVQNFFRTCNDSTKLAKALKEAAKVSKTTVAV